MGRAASGPQCLCWMAADFIDPEDDSQGWREYPGISAPQFARMTGYSRYRIRPAPPNAQPEAWRSEARWQEAGLLDFAGKRNRHLLRTRAKLQVCGALIRSVGAIPAGSTNTRGMMDKKTVIGHCCDSCCRAAGLTPKFPPDSRERSVYCSVCGHYGIGSDMELSMTKWAIYAPVALPTKPEE